MKIGLLVELASLGRRRRSGGPCLATTAFSFSTETSACAALNAGSSLAPITLTTTPSKNTYGGKLSGAVKRIHFAWSNINLIWPAALFGSKSGVETTTNGIPANFDNAFAVSVCSNIRGEIARSKSRFCVRNASASRVSFAISSVRASSTVFSNGLANQSPANSRNTPTATIPAATSLTHQKIVTQDEALATAEETIYRTRIVDSSTYFLVLLWAVMKVRKLYQHRPSISFKVRR